MQNLEFRIVFSAKDYKDFLLTLTGMWVKLIRYDKKKKSYLNSVYHVM